MSRPLRILAGLTAAALMLTGCAAAGGTSTPDAASSEPVTGGTLSYLEHQAHTSLYPPTAGFYPNGALVGNITDRLLHQNPETLELEPWIATEWSANEDATAFTFTLRDDVTFSDGSPLDARVVAKNFDTFGLGDPARGLTVSEAINNYAASEVLDERTVRFTFSAPAPGFLQATSTINSGLLSADTLDRRYEDYGPGNSAEIIGSGPFTIDAEELGQSVHLAARTDYAWAPASATNQGRPYVDAVAITIAPEASVRVGALLSGQAHVIRNLEAQDESRVEVPGFSVAAPQTNGVNNSLSLRFRHPILADIRVRQALIAGIDREELVSTIYTKNYPLATSTLSQTALGYEDQSAQLGTDRTRAAALLDEAGWVPGADGIRVKDGARLALTVNEAAPQPRSFDALTLIAQQLAGIGVELIILKADAGSYAQAILDPDRVQIYHSMVGRTDLDVIKSQFAGANRNTLLNRDPADDSIGDPELETLLTAVASTADPAARTEASHAVQRYLSAQAYVIPLFEEPQVYGVSDAVGGLAFESVARPDFSAVWVRS